MALVFADRVKETTTTTGMGTYTLGGAVTGFQSFAAIGNGNTCYYAVTDGTNWEVGLGTYTSSGTTLARTTVLASSNSGSAVSWGAGTKTIFVDVPKTHIDALPIRTTGTWTPALQIGGSSVGITYANRTGRYINIDALVFLDGRVNLSSKGGLTGAVFLGGFPFTPGAAGCSLVTSAYSGFSGLTSAPFGYAGGAGVNVQMFGAAVGSNVDGANLTNTSDWYFSVTFRV